MCDVIAGNEAEVFVEVVRGLGETLVGNYPGAALAAVIDKKALKAAAAKDGDTLTEPATSAEAVRCVLCSAPMFHIQSGYPIPHIQLVASCVQLGESNGVLLPFWSQIG